MSPHELLGGGAYHITSFRVNILQPKKRGKRETERGQRERGGGERNRELREKKRHAG